MATKKPRTTTEALKKLATAEHKRAHAQVLARLNDPIAAHYERADAAALDAAAQAALAKLAKLQRHVQRFPALGDTLKKLFAPTLEKALTFLDDKLLPSTSNAVERGNRRSSVRCPPPARTPTRSSAGCSATTARVSIRSGRPGRSPEAGAAVGP